jgi:hypothetical protein
MEDWRQWKYLEAQKDRGVCTVRKTDGHAKSGTFCKFKYFAVDSSSPTTAAWHTAKSICAHLRWLLV